ncbi:MAG: efflux RND transporter periplasmic adaptor subunit [Planctomycetes bacterium]|nr:efflux RND transporter periplasmic adaptor subunit [Planctomycetota bacterium]
MKYTTVSFLAESFLAVIGCLVASSITLGHEGHAALPSKGAKVDGETLMITPTAEKALGLELAKVRLDDMHRTVRANARVEIPWRQQALVTTLVSGKISRCLVKPGQHVQAREELARVESLELESMQLAMLQASGQMNFAEIDVNRKTPLAQQGIIAVKAVAEAETALQQHRATLAIAHCKLRALGLGSSVLEEVLRSRTPRSSFSIRSPMDGVVAEADVRVGQFVSTTKQLFHVVDPSTVWVVGEVLETDISGIRVGLPVSAHFASIANQKFEGKVHHLHSKIDSRTRTQSVVLSVDNSEGLLKPGMFGKLDIHLASFAEAIVCPTDALVQVNDKIYVLLYRGKGKYLRREVSVGIRTREQAEILKGLFPGDRVIVTGTNVLASLFGSETTPRNATAATTKEKKSRPLVVQGIVEIPTEKKVFATSRIEGRLVQILVDQGEQVQTGQILAFIDSLELRNLQGDLLEARVQAAWTNGRLEKLRNLQGSSAIKQLWERENEYQVLQNSISTLTRKLLLVGLSREDIERITSTDFSAKNCEASLVTTVPLRSPSDGWVASFDVVPGEIVQPTQVLFEMNELSKVWVKGHIYQQDAAIVHLGKTVRVTFPSQPELTVTGQVVRMAPLLASSKRVIPLWIEIDNSEQRLVEGMLARVEIASLMLPQRASQK